VPSRLSVVTALVLAPVIIPAKLVNAELLAHHNLAGLTSFSQLLVGAPLLLLFVSLLRYGCLWIVRDHVVVGPSMQRGGHTSRAGGGSAER